MEDLTRHVERAVLGALLSGAGPAQAGDLHGGDFTDPVHQAIFTAITSPDLASSGWRGAVGRLVARLRTGGVRAHESYMAELPGACPDAGHLASYIQILLSTRQRRAAEARTEPSGANSALASATDWLSSRSRASARAGTDTGPPQEVTRLATALSGQARRMTTTTRPAVAPGPALAPPPVPERLTRERVEELVLADLMNRPGDGHEVIGWLPGDSFTCPQTSQLYELISGLLGNDSPVDPVILAWEASELARTVITQGRQPVIDSAYVLRLAALATPPGTASVLGRGLFADQVCTVKLGSDWVSKPGLTRPASATDTGQTPGTETAPRSSLAVGNQAPLASQNPRPPSRQATAVRFQQPQPEPGSPAPVPRA